MRVTPAALLAALLLAAAAPGALAATDDLVPVAEDAGAAGRPSLSADGRLVAYPDSDASRAVVRDVAAGTTRVVGQVAAGTSGTRRVGLPVLSDSGRFACVLVDDGTAPDAELVVRDLVQDAEVLARPALRVDAVRGAGDQPLADPDPGARDCDVSDDGGRVAFVTRDALVADDTNADEDVYVVDRSTSPPTPILVSRATGAAGAIGDGPSLAPVMTPDGRRVAFRSLAALGAGDDPARGDVFVRDLTSDTTTWISRADGPAGGPGTATVAAPGGGATGGSMSADGRYVAFATRANLTPRLDGSQAYVRDTVAGTTQLVSAANYTIFYPSGMSFTEPAAATDPQLSGDGRWVAFGGIAGSFDRLQAATTTPATVLHDRSTNRTAVISRQAGIFGAPLTGPASSAALSADGRFAAFGLAPGTVLRRELDPARPLPADLLGPPVVTLPEQLPGLAAPGGRPAPGGLGGAVALTLREYAQLRTSVQVGRRGRAVRTGCVSDGPTTRFAPACVLYADALGGATLDGLEGTTLTTSAGLLGTSSLAPGRYRLRITATDLAGTTSTVDRPVEAGSPQPLDRFGHLDLRRPVLSGARRGRRIRIPVTCNRLEVTCRTSVSVRLGTRTITRGTVRLAPGSARTVELPVGTRDARRIRGRGRAVRATVVLTTVGRGTERVPVRVTRASVFKLLPVRG